jgi:hypothetical protein
MDAIGVRCLSSAHLRRMTQRRKFTGEEDAHLRALVDHMGTRNWDDIARSMHGRTARQCRDRYKNYLLDSLVLAPWTPEEDAIVRQYYQQMGPKWVEIAKFLTGRSSSHVKNRWHRHLARPDDGKCDIIEPAAWSEPEDSTDEQKQDEETSVLLCPVLHLGKHDWSELFDRMETGLGYESAWRSYQ